MYSLLDSGHSVLRSTFSKSHNFSGGLSKISRFRSFSTTCTCFDNHYKTLGIPVSATKNQIKASYYSLSKQLHPDINKHADAKEKFQAVNEAYAVLGDERQRRAYDRSQMTSSQATHSYHEPGHTPWSYDGRRRGATHAWEYARRPNTHRSHAYSPPGASQHYTQHPAGPNPFHNSNVHRATGRGPLPSDKGPSPYDHIARESVFARVLQVTGLVVVVGFIAHGVSASAA